ncbi:UDP-N-acetylglucosamine 2-epimerase (non-hydrolyzing) [Polaribacter haliotis]|uniref:UDP-N-acetylglucosamine 2-epimerase (Non-hydrolyzing) n=1 Tax=Polaribacter haliotis TaxID=1888915 RepID=A0A7L8AHL8_9FLAO|nr:UDP-N-acetylglucosamine 2-epimerase (non-hydrolyzing) [Polaribacter haliotis]QOD61503.1 UDP-N-acetylglucosamine 2-epimerase (non-hydrolyzing) [Polaribacter haliotis]
MLITIIAGARPNFVKIAPIIHEIKRQQEKGIDVNFQLVHTGQHYDKKLSGTFFEELNIPDPNVNLEIGSGSQAEQTAGIMVAFEKYLQKNRSDVVLVVGDVTSTMACAIVAKKMQIKVVHVEGGIRSFDLFMPEEINRMVTDAITDYFYVTSNFAIENLKNLGFSNERIILVGNTMIDTLIANIKRLKAPQIYNEFSLEEKKYIVLTMHRPANVDEELKLKLFLEEIVNSSRGLPIIFPVHPRTKEIIKKLNLVYDNLFMIEPLGYLEFNYLVKNCFCVITDSGGITEETTYLKVPCLTLRDNTERPETISIGTNKLVGTNPKLIKDSLEQIFDGKWKKGEIPAFWDGKTSQRIINHIIGI